jgi:hypothetical protein
VKLKKTNFLLFLSKGKHRCISPSLWILLYNYPSVIIDLCIYVIGLNETLECIIPFVYNPDPIVVENPLVMLCLVDRTPVEVEWQTPLVRFRTFYTLVRD